MCIRKAYGWISAGARIRTLDLVYLKSLKRKRRIKKTKSAVDCGNVIAHITQLPCKSVYEIERYC